METLIDKNKLSINSLKSLIGNTPLFEFNRLVSKPEVRIFAKLEWQQLSGSVKARTAFSIIYDALNTNQFLPGMEIIDASSGNTAIAYASICAKIGIPLNICLPENASNERKQMLKYLGAKLIYTSKYGGTDEAQDIANKLASGDPTKYFYANQYSNNANWRAHYNGTADEIWRQTNGEVTHFVAGLGTTGTFCGTVRKLKELNPGLKGIALQPDGPMHGLEGWKHLETVNIPKIFDASLVDENLFIDSVEAYAFINKISKSEGLLVSPSSAANLLGAFKKADEIDKGVIVTILPDSIEKYSEVLKNIN